MSDKAASPWGDFGFEVGERRFWRVGPSAVWIERTEQEWRVASEESGEEGLVVAASEAAPPETAAWMRWAGEPSLCSIRLSPITPDRPVVVRPGQPFRILQNGSARVYVSLPVWVRIELLAEDTPLRMIELPTVRLSNTWFGSLFEGELCYWLETSARRTVEARPPRPHIATAPVVVRNTGQEELPLESMCVHAAHLGVYEDSRGLWTSEVQVTSSGSAEPQRIEVSAGAPPEAAAAERRSAPREQQRQGGILARAVGLLQALPGGA